MIFIAQQLSSFNNKVLQSLSIEFGGDDAKLLMRNEVLGRKNKNYYQLMEDGKSYRRQMQLDFDTIDLKLLKN